MQLVVLICACLSYLAAGGQRRPWPRRAPPLPIGELGKRFHPVAHNFTFVLEQGSSDKLGRHPEAVPPRPGLILNSSASPTVEAAPAPTKSEPIFMCARTKVSSWLSFGSHVAPKVGNVTEPAAAEFPRGDPCVWGLTKLFWATLLTAFSLALIFLAIPVMLEITRRRAPGQPLFLFGIECYGCCDTNGPPADDLLRQRAILAAMKGMAK
eukprot:TRINITY_DN5272_c0_g1_i2.p1 TRINITY_DN5272_c0_g1~~TRINITY_DN5272_c0_g1_i2.p1  ORF type:complete len:236 (+),score=24.40 TRINITY_DN5272_c0_g1_i2:81-710(+)